MYVTRPLSMYMRSLELLSLPPPEGPNSGYLVLQDEESIQTTCFGMCKDIWVKQLPFPQNMDLTVTYTEDINDEVTFIPVLDQPLSSNTYYVIHRSGRHRGEACTSWKDTGLFRKNYIHDVESKPLDPLDVYQQMEIRHLQRWSNEFTAKSVAPDGFPPSFLRNKGWSLTRHTPLNYELGEAQGLNSSLQSRLPGLDFPLSSDPNDCSEAVVVGKWYCPFMFIKEGGVKLKEQMKRCVFYEMRLEQRWERFSALTMKEQIVRTSVFVDTFVPREVVFVGGSEAVWDDRKVSGGFMWFKSLDGVEGGEKSVGLSMKIVERMKWEQERVGWVSGDEKQVRVERVEEFGGTPDEWKRFACYVLVERFVLKRMDERLAVLAYDFKHTHQIRSKMGMRDLDLVLGIEAIKYCGCI